MVSGDFAPWLDPSRSNTHIDYSSFFHPLPSQTRLAEVQNSACEERSNFWLELTDLERSNHGAK